MNRKIENFLKKNKIMALIVMFIVMAVLVILLGYIQSKYLENFEQSKSLIKCSKLERKLKNLNLTKGEGTDRLWCSGGGGFCGDCPKNAKTKRKGTGQFYYGQVNNSKGSYKCEYKGDGNFYKNRCRPVKYIKIQRKNEKDGPLTLMEVEVFNKKGKNIAGSGTATQSSTAYNGTPEKAINGETDQNYSGKEDTNGTHTKNEKNPWWLLTLRRQIARNPVVKIYNRTDCCKDRIHDAEIMLLDKNSKVIAKRSWDKDGEDIQTFSF